MLPLATIECSISSSLPPLPSIIRPLSLSSLGTKVPALLLLGRRRLLAVTTPLILCVLMLLVLWVLLVLLLMVGRKRRRRVLSWPCPRRRPLVLLVLVLVMGMRLVRTTRRRGRR